MPYRQVRLYGLQGAGMDTPVKEIGHASIEVEAANPYREGRPSASLALLSGSAGGRRQFFLDGEPKEVSRELRKLADHIDEMLIQAEVRLERKQARERQK